MFSATMTQLWQSGALQRAVWETVYMTFLAGGFSYLFGLPLGLLLAATDKGGLCRLPWLNRVLGLLVNVFRSIPFVILMVTMLPVAKAIVGTSIGNRAMIVMLVLAATPYVARMVESAVKEVDAGVIEAAQSMGATDLTILVRVLLPEAAPSLIQGAIISTVTILGYSAMAATIGGGGLGTIAITYGYQRFNPDVKWACVLLTVLIVQIIQEVGVRIVRKTDKRIKT